MDKKLKAELLFLIPFTFCWFILFWVYSYSIFTIIFFIPFMSLSYIGFLRLLKNGYKNFPYYRTIMITLGLITTISTIIVIYIFTHPLPI
ncbi:hypothetical protein [Sulfolobus spindle-shaped virus]|nr:hypothetical protein [Sulfolobus spindle-shaped virus]AZG03233.1 hypothetical protein [Sulfolobus spindle-shaped virus]AZG03308.1 hypothetical protein [Sulfolobus spindle-shaped virus]AZG03368.1 hypothetical protein [Sulfolobus spindle-shaped virus]AZG03426.1 hypothetical protein [Sulfolobus spindle-shaped virus]